MNKKTIIKVFSATLALYAATSAFAESAPKYISPNNDGIQDECVVPLKIKEKRYVKSWNLTIYDEDNNIVRVIGNKISLPEKVTFKTFFKTLMTSKQGVEIPSQVVWNGYLGKEVEDLSEEVRNAKGYVNGSIAPDGLYYYDVSASDDNDNEARTSKHAVIVDNTAPSVSIAALSDAEKSFGEGSKLTLKISQSGSKEDKWEAYVKNMDEKIVHTFTTENAEPLTIEWDGTDDEGKLVPDGVYNYEITSTDRAGNISEKAGVNNIIYSAEKPEVGVSIKDSRYFAPGVAGALNNMNLKVSIGIPASKANGLTSWKVEIFDKDLKNVYKVYSGDSTVNENITWNGQKDNTSEIVKEGEYVAKVSAVYKNGYSPSSVSPVFVVDTTAPQAYVSCDSTVFGKNPLKISQSDSSKNYEWSAKTTWLGRVLDSQGKAVKTFYYNANIPQEIYWNGFDDKGNIVENGDYIYELSAVDQAGNRGAFQTKLFTFDTSDSAVAVTLSAQAFNLTKGKLALKSDVITKNGIKSYKLTIKDSSGATVKEFTGNGNPSSFQWDGFKEDGSRVDDGEYTVVLNTVANNGNEDDSAPQTVVIDTVDPRVKVTVPDEFRAFSPDGVSSKQSIAINVAQDDNDTSKESLWTASVKKGNAVVKTFVWHNSKPTDFEWDGTDESGNVVSNGTYSIVLESTDIAGNKGSVTVDNIIVDTTPVTAYVTSKYTAISPNEKSTVKAQEFNVKTTLNTGIAAWNFDIVDANGNSVKKWNQNDSKDLPSNFTWAGDTSSGTVGEGKFTGKLSIEYAKGNKVETSSASFICTAFEPKVKAQYRTTTSGNWFSPDNDGVDDDLYIILDSKSLLSVKNWSFVIYDRNEKEFWKTSGKSNITKNIIWDGRGNNGETVQSAENYKFAFSVTDELGMTSVYNDEILVDVLVVREGDYLKMQVPSIIFRSDAADFGLAKYDDKGKITNGGITADQKKQNEAVLKRISEILKKFDSYKVTVVGHANPTTTDPLEETQDGKWGKALIPLSKERASYVVDILIGYGINANRLQSDGKGGTEYIVDPKDTNNRWKNRRVEFILIKK